MKPTVDSNFAEGASDQGGARSRVFVAAWVGLVACAYVVAIILGKIPQDRRLSGSDLGVILIAIGGLGILLNPEFLQRLTHLKVGNVELELHQLQRDQQKQQNELEDVRFILTLLLQKNELRHLKNLENGITKDYEGNHNLRTEVRKLRTLGLIRSLPDRHISELADKLKVDLSKFVELTERGKQYLERLGEYDSG